MTLPRPQRPGSVHAMISDLLDAAGRKNIEAELGKSQSTLSRWSDPSEENGRRMGVPDLDLICRLFSAAAVVHARHSASLAGGYFVPGVPGEGDVASKAGEVILRVSETQAALMQALGAGSELPGDLTPEEAVAIRPLVQEDIDALGRLMALVEDRARGGADRDGDVVPMAKGGRA